MAVDISADTIIDKAFAGFKKITPALVAVSLVSGAILFLPKAILELLGLHALSDNVRTTIGVTFLLSVALIITIVVSSCWKMIARKIKHKNMQKNLKKRFVALAPKQKEIVLELMKSEDKVILLDMASGNARYLEHNHFIYHPEQMIVPGYDDVLCVKYVPHPWLIDLYNKEPDLFS